MEKIVEGYVFMVRRHVNGDIDIGFSSDDDELELRYFVDSTKTGSLTKEIADALAETLGRNIWVQIRYNDDGILSGIELEEFDPEDDLM